MSGRTLGALVRETDERDGDGTAPALRGDRDYGRETFRTRARKTGNFLSHHGVHAGATVAVADEPAPQPLLALFGAALLGAAVRFGPPRESDQAAVFASGSPTLADLSEGVKPVGYGDPPERPGVAHFGRDVWSENPGFPPGSVAPEEAALADGTTHGALRAAADRASDDLALAPGVAVAPRSPLSEPGTLAAGVVAPLAAGATVVLRDGATGDVAVARGGAPEPQTAAPSVYAP